MRILYIDIDSLRPAHLGCYGYHRATSPNIDRIAREGARIERLYATDTPCLPSRTAFFGGRFGAQSGVVNHGGVCADLPPQGADRDFRSRAAENSLASLLTRCGYWTASISPFPRRHSGYQMAYGFHETVDTGRGGLENADEIYAEVERWLHSRGTRDNWFLHVNMWDPHTPYDTPLSFGNPFHDQPIAPWLNQEILDRQWESYGPHSAREVPHFDDRMNPDFYLWGRPQIRNLEDAKVHLDAYDTGVNYADLYVGKIVDTLAALGVLEDTAIVVAADHGENLGELNVWGDHQTADEFTNRIPGIVRWPGKSRPGSVVGGLHYHLDLASTLVDLASPKGKSELERAGWMGRSLAGALAGEPESGRDRLFLSQGAWSLQRTVRWDKWILIHTVDTGIKDFSEWMLFDLESDPHETRNLASQHPELVEAMGLEIQQAFSNWSSECPLGDPFEVVKSEGGAYHARYNGGDWGPYLERLRATGRAKHADWLQANGNRPRPTDLAAY